MVEQETAEQAADAGAVEEHGHEGARGDEGAEDEDEHGPVEGDEEEEREDREAVPRLLGEKVGHGLLGVRESERGRGRVLALAAVVAEELAAVQVADVDVGAVLGGPGPRDLVVVRGDGHARRAGREPGEREGRGPVEARSRG